MLIETSSQIDIQELRASFDGAVVTPADEGWDAARAAWHMMSDQRPVAVAIPAGVADVQRAVRWAAAAGVRVAPQAEGHNAGAFRSLERTLLVRTTGLTDVEIDVAARIARVGAGAKWRDVTAPASEHGLAALHGSSPEVGVTGYSLGGGIGWYARKHGLQANSLTAIEIVTADGDLVRATASEHADLFWALRGGGGNFGIVTTLEFRLIPIAEAYAGMLAFPAERSTEVMHRWLAWTRTAPETVTTSARILHIPPLPELPEIVRGRSLVVLDGAVLGTEAEARDLLAPLRALGPEIDTFAMVPPAVVPYIHMDPEDPMPGLGVHQMYEDLTHDAIDAFVDVAMKPGSRLMLAELRHLGGALGRAPEDAGALGRLDGAYLSYVGGIVMAPEVVDPLKAELAGFLASMAPWDHGRRYGNFSEQPTDPTAIFTPEALERLRAVKDDYDPANVFRANHEVAPDA